MLAPTALPKIPEGCYWYPEASYLVFTLDGVTNRQADLNAEEKNFIATAKPIYVSFVEINLTVTAVQSLAQFSSITKLAITGECYSMPGIAQALYGLSKLKHLSITKSSSVLTETMFLALAKLKFLSSLHVAISNMITPICIAALNDLNLRELFFSREDSKPPAADIFIPLAKNTSLRTLGFSNILPSLKAMHAIIQIPQLRKLVITTPSSEQHICTIAASKSLTELSINITGGISQKAAKSLAKMYSLQTLELSCYNYEFNTTIRKAISSTIVLIAQSATLSSIRLDDVYLNQMAAIALSRMPQLTTLRLRQLVAGLGGISQKQIQDISKQLTTSNTITDLELQGIIPIYIMRDDFKFTLAMARDLAKMSALQKLTLDLETIILEPAAAVLNALSASSTLIQLDIDRKIFNRLYLADTNPDKKSIVAALTNLQQRLYANYTRACALLKIYVLIVFCRANSNNEIKNSILSLLPEVMNFLEIPLPIGFSSQNPHSFFINMNTISNVNVDIPGNKNQKLATS